MISRFTSSSTFHFAPFSEKQLKVLSWYEEYSPYKDCMAIIADGAIRSGKTVSMALSFVIWGNNNFNNQNFAICGKTIASTRRNVVSILKQMLSTLGYVVYDRRTDNLLVVQGMDEHGKFHTNNYFIFGGKDESSQDLIQGITLAGIFFDEVALQPQSFVNQATARCSVEGSKYWFNCNPKGPFHWFNTEWIEPTKRKEKNILYIHFDMEDNLTLSPRMLEQYKSNYSGVFYQRYILGLWIMAEGIIYPEFNKNKHCITMDQVPESVIKGVKYISSDYGITNPQVFLKAGFTTIEGKKHVFILDEYYNNKKDKAKTDVLFLKDYKKFTENDKTVLTIIDPSAESLINLFRQNNIMVRGAENAVIPGIENVSMWLKEGRIHIVEKNCPNLLKEFGTYVWNPKAQMQGKDEPLKENDHALDSCRYLLNTLFPIRMPVRIRYI